MAEFVATPLSPESIVRRLVRQYCKYVEGEYTGPFSKFAPDVQAKLLQLAEVEDGEVPAVASYVDDTNWLLLTSRYLTWFQHGTRRRIDLNEIKDAIVERLEPLRAKLPDSPRWQGLPPLKITVVTEQGALDIEVEPHGPFYGLWTALELVSTLVKMGRII